MNDHFATPDGSPPPAPMVAPPIPVEITEPAPSVPQNDFVADVQVDAPPQEPPSEASPPRSQGRTCRPPSYLADFDLS